MYVRTDWLWRGPHRTGVRVECFTHEERSSRSIQEGGEPSASHLADKESLSRTSQ